MALRLFLLASYVLNNGASLGVLNHIVMVLIPKVQSPTTVVDFRPFCLCNIVYRIITKVIANRLKSVLSAAISQNLSAFIPGMLIIANVIVRYECLHKPWSCKSQNDGLIAMNFRS